VAAARRASSLRWTLLIDRHEDTGTLVLQLTGRLGMTTAAPLEQALDAALREPHACVVADLSGVDYVSSAGLSVLERATTRFGEAGRRLVVRSLQEPVAVGFEVAGAGSRLDLGEAGAITTDGD